MGWHTFQPTDEHRNDFPIQIVLLITTKSNIYFASWKRVFFFFLIFFLRSTAFYDMLTIIMKYKLHL
jgi:hypothetical protein